MTDDDNDDEDEPDFIPFMTRQTEKKNTAQTSNHCKLKLKREEKNNT